MSQETVAGIPPPLRFELGRREIEGEAAGILLVTIDDDGKPRVATLSAQEIRVLDDLRLRFDLRRASTSRRNARKRPSALWCVLDAAAYTLRGMCRAIAEVPDRSDHDAFEMTVTSVLRDFKPSEPFVSGPKYRRIGK